MPEPQPNRVEELFHRAADLQPDQRRQFLATQCGGDTRLLAEVEALLQHDHGDAPTAAFLVSPVAEAVAALSPSTLSAAGTSLLAIPGYEMRGVLGAGGMGVVYKARQISLNRLVALKVLLPGTSTLPEALTRFRIEAEALAQLQHPNIVQVFDQGEQEGRPFFAMEYVNGPSLAAILEKGPQGIPASAHLIEVLARAMHTVHQNGIVHRDLKPANILLASDAGEGGPPSQATLSQLLLIVYHPKITDFGVAKLLEAKESQTLSGSILGTPWYMAPEQAEGHNRSVGPAADTYALGAILYEMLTGRPPFQGASLLETLEEVRTREPLAPRQLRPNVPRDLETICMKCLQKDPARRYASALALAEDLARFGAGEPILARPVGRYERAYRWCRRHPLVAGLWTGVVLLAVALVTSVLIYQIQLHQTLALVEKTSEERRQLLVQVDVSSGMNELDEGYSFMALLWFTEALRLDEGDADRERNHRIRIGVTSRQFPRLLQLLAKDQPLSCARMSPDGRWVLTAAEDGMARLWNLPTAAPGPELPHEQPVHHAAFGPDGRLLVTVTTDGTTRIWETATGKAQGPPFPEGKLVDQVAFSGTGEILCTHRIDHRIRLRATATGERVPFSGMTEKAPSYSTISADGRWLLVVDDAHIAQLWSLDAARPAGEPLRLEEPVQRAGVSPDGKRVVIVTPDGAARVWSTVLGQQLGEPLRHLRAITYAAFSPEGDRVVTTSGDLTAKIWRANTGELLISGLRHEGFLEQAAFSPDGRLLVTSGGDNQARVWDARTGEMLTPPLRHNGGIFYAALSPDSKRLVTAGRDNTVRLWELTSPPRTIVSDEPLPPGTTESRSPDGRWLISFGKATSTRVRDAATGAPVGPPLQHGSLVTFAAFSPDANRVVTASDDNTVRIWNSQTGQLLVPPLHHRGTVYWVAFSSDGSRLITVAEDHTARVWDATTGERLTPPFKHPCQVRRAWFGADDRQVLTLGEDRRVRTWDLTPDTRPLSILLLEANVLSGHRLDDKRGLVPLEEDRLRAAWETLRSGQSTVAR